MYGGYPVYVAGTTWLTIWSLIAGFSVNDLMLNFCRALQGLGPAAFLPSSVMVLGSIYRPGPRKNLVFSIYGFNAVLGFFVGIFFAGVTAEYTTWVGISGSEPFSQHAQPSHHISVYRQISRRNATLLYGQAWIGLVESLSFVAWCCLHLPSSTRRMPLVGGGRLTSTRYLSSDRYCSSLLLTSRHVWLLSRCYHRPCSRSLACQPSLWRFSSRMALSAYFSSTQHIIRKILWGRHLCKLWLGTCPWR